MLKKLWTNGVWLMWCMALLLTVGTINYPPLAGAQGVELQGLALDLDRGVDSLSVPAADQGGIDSYTKLMLHADGSDQGTSFTDSSSSAKTVTNTETYDSYTKLMLHMDGNGNSFTDSATSKAITANGNVTQTAAQFKFDSRTAFFDGSGDYLSLADSDDWNFGSGDFTIDFLVMLADTGEQRFAAQWEDGDSYWMFDFQPAPTNLLRFVYRNNGSQETIVSRSWSPSTNILHHLAVVRYGNNWYIAIDGDIGTATSNSSNLVNFNGSFYIGYIPVTAYLTGWLEEYRISKGIARWTSDFTPPSSPYGKVYTVTGTKKFGTASGEFKGSGEYLSLADSDDWAFGSGDFTIDTWVYLNQLGIDQDILSQSGATSNDAYWRLGLTNGNAIQFDNRLAGSTYTFRLTGASGMQTGQWYHIAVVRSGTDLKLYKDGVVLLSNTVLFSDSLVNPSSPLLIGGISIWPGYLNGYLDELRVSKGIVRWTSNFTPPSAPYETDTTAPTVSSTSPASSATGVGVSSAISATFSEDMDSSTITTSTFTLSSSSGSSVTGTVSYSNKVVTFTPSSSLSYSTTYTATITTGVKDISGNAMSSTYTWSFTTSSTPDTTAPSGSVSINSGASYTNSSTVTLILTGTDSVGVTGYYLSDSSTTPSVSASGWTSVTSTTSYSGTVSYSLSSGEGSKTIYAWYKDAAGNVSSTASATITLDTTVPTVTISSPTSSSTYTATSGTISLGGSASDSSSGIGTVTWINNRGGNGTATGTASWTVSSISLSSGDNVITVTAKDGANNSGMDTLQVTYGTGTTISAPTVSTGSASSVTTSSTTLNGTVNANGASTTAWFQYGSTSGSYGNTSSTQSVTGSSNTTVSIGISGLSSGTKYYYRIAASNSGGTSYGSESSFTTSTASATPTPSSTPNPSDTTTPTPTATPTATTTPKPSPTAQPTPTRPPTLPPLPTPQPQVSPTATPAGGSGSVFGNVEDNDGNALEGVTVTIERAASQGNISGAVQKAHKPYNKVGAENLQPLHMVRSKDFLDNPKQEGIGEFTDSTETDENGYYEFSGLAKGNYTLTYEKDGYQTKTKSVTLKEGEEKDIRTTVLEEEGALGKIYGYVVDIKGNPLESVKLKLKGLKTGVKGLETSDGDGFFEFEDLGADKYILTVQKKRYRKAKQTITLEEGESKEIEIEMRKTSKRIKGLLLKEDIQ